MKIGFKNCKPFFAIHLLTKLLLWYFVLVFLSYQHEVSAKLTNRQILKMKMDAMKVLNGTKDPTLQALGMIMQTDSTYSHGEFYISDAVLFSPQCVVTKARQMADYNYFDGEQMGYYDVVPYIDDRRFRSMLFPRPQCDTQYHASEIYLNYPTWNHNNTYNDIAVIKLKMDVIQGEECGGTPIHPAWVSCDSQGPPPGYTSCYVISYGETSPTSASADGLKPPDYTSAKSTPMTILSTSDCSNASHNVLTPAVDPKNQICAQTPDGQTAACYYDANPVLVCKYWGNSDVGNSDTSSGWNNGSGWAWSNNGWVWNSGGWTWNGSGWAWNSNGWSSSQTPPVSNNGWGWNKNKKSTNEKLKKADNKQGWGWNDQSGDYYENMLVVGHMVNRNSDPAYDDDYCTGSPGADYYVKYGSTTYNYIFERCGAICSSDLEEGYQCQGNPPADLGPVYCIPEKNPNYSSTTNGWRSVKS